jgi:pimeloyl-ACP methyl ester carboxylesterase
VRCWAVDRLALAYWCWSSSAPTTGVALLVGCRLARMPGARVEWLPVVGHTPMMDDPQSTGKLLLDYAEATAPAT